VQDASIGVKRLKESMAWIIFPGDSCVAYP